MHWETALQTPSRWSLEETVTKITCGWSSRARRGLSTLQMLGTAGRDRVEAKQESAGSSRAAAWSPARLWPISWALHLSFLRPCLALSWEGLKPKVRQPIEDRSSLTPLSRLGKEPRVTTCTCCRLWGKRASAGSCTQVCPTAPHSAGLWRGSNAPSSKYYVLA